MADETKYENVDIGAGWKKEYAKGKTRTSWSLNKAELQKVLERTEGDKVFLTSFDNTFKKEENQPDYQMLASFQK